jgi:hypothetical protein
MATRAKRRAIKNAVETRRLYRFEDLALPIVAKYPVSDAPMKTLRSFATRVWRAETTRKMPKIVAGAGVLGPAGTLYSYCNWPERSLIVLARHHRNRSVVLHELVHALGYGTHGRGFVRKYFDLLAKYARCNRAQLESHAKTLNVKH